tara:strand:+ start:18387 stop:18707 length:321 start_codon:yes stop_codon:yes gene_type:complete
MGKPVKVTKSDLAYLAKALKQNKPYTEMARHLGICVDTVKRILHREGLAEFDGAKYVVALSSDKHMKMWERPCMKCKCTKPRPKWQYICTKCKEKFSKESESIWDF